MRLGCQEPNRRKALVTRELGRSSSSGASGRGGKNRYYRPSDGRRQSAGGRRQSETAVRRRQSADGGRAAGDARRHHARSKRSSRVSSPASTHRRHPQSPDCRLPTAVCRLDSPVGPGDGVRLDRRGAPTVSHARRRPSGIGSRDRAAEAAAGPPAAARRRRSSAGGQLCAHRDRPLLERGSLSQRWEHAGGIRLQRVRPVRVRPERRGAASRGARSVSDGPHDRPRSRGSGRSGVLHHRDAWRLTCRHRPWRRPVRPCAKQHRCGPRRAVERTILVRPLHRRATHRVTQIHGNPRSTDSRDFPIHGIHETQVTAGQFETPSHGATPDMVRP
jgi:hypothetical protein